MRYVPKIKQQCLDLPADEECSCPTWKTLEFELCEIFVLTVMGLGAMYGANNLVFRSKGMLKKLKEKKKIGRKKGLRN